MDVDAGTLEEAQRCLAARDWAGARALLGPLVAADPAQRTWLYALCEAEIADGAPGSAAERLGALAAAGDAEAQFLAARAQAAQGHHAAAITTFLALRERVPGISANLEAHLATSLELQGDLEGACAARERVVQASPQDAGARIDLARLQLALARTGTAHAHLDAAMRLGPRDAAAWRQVGRCCADLFDWPRAVKALGEAARLEPGQASDEALLALALREIGEAGAAREVLRNATTRDPGNLDAAVASRLLLPQVYAHPAHLEAARAGYLEGLEALADPLAPWQADAGAVFTLAHTNFLLAYQGRDDRDAQHGYSRFLAGLARRAAPALFEPLPVRFDGGRALRVGFCSSFLRDCTVGRYFERWITALEPEHFEVHVYHYGLQFDDVTRRIGARAAQLVRLPGTMREAAARLRADALDVLVYPEVGMDAWGYVLATLRLAPVQLAAWGHPVTTGSAAIDGYFTVDGMEPGNAADHYTEPLLRLPGVGIDHPLPGPLPSRDRAAFGLREGVRIYACPQSLFKIHPDMDRVFASLAALDPGAVLLFAQAGAAATRAFAGRLAGAFASASVSEALQVRFAPPLPRSEFQALLANCDVVLDTLHWSGGGTTFDALGAGTPVITVPGEFMRGRQTCAMLQAMELHDLVAADADDLARRAVAVARDRSRLRDTRERIGRSRPAIFETPEATRAFAQRLMDAAAGGLAERYT